jgi:hypothetical protein
LESADRGDDVLFFAPVRVRNYPADEKNKTGGRGTVRMQGQWIRLMFRQSIRFWYADRDTTFFINDVANVHLQGDRRTIEFDLRQFGSPRVELQFDSAEDALRFKLLLPTPTKSNETHGDSGFSFGRLRSIIVGIATALAVIGSVARSYHQEVVRDREEARALIADPATRAVHTYAPIKVPDSLHPHAPSAPMSKIPVFVVRGDGAAECNFIKFTLTRLSGDSTALSIDVAQDTPGEIGAGTRACIWVATMIAGLERSDDLSGVKIQLDLPGRVDGPSAGGAISLAILAALDDKRPPADCVMIGSIMPDGTIADVGGVPGKLRAAAKAGVRRVLVPSFLRFEKDVKSGQEVDLRELAESLNLEMLPVDSVSQAYRTAYGLDVTPQAVLDQRVLDLPKTTDQLLQQRYAADIAAGEKLWEALPGEQRQRPSFSLRFCIREREKAEAGYRAGRALHATAIARLWREALEARQRKDAIFGSLNGTDFKANLQQTDAKLHETLDHLPDPLDLIVAARTQFPDIGLQLCGGWYEFAEVLGSIDGLQASLDTLVAAIDKPENQGKERQEELTDRAYELRAMQLILANVTLAALQHATDDDKELATTLPQRSMTADAWAVEHLLSSAYQAAENTLESDVVNVAASELQVSEGHAFAAMIDHDVSLQMYVPHAKVLRLLDQRAGRHRAMDDGQIIAATTAYAYAGGLSHIYSITTRWSALDVSIGTKGDLAYGRTDQLKYLLDQAHANALMGIAECQGRGIPCVVPISSFESAEIHRDDNKTDKVDVLADYWNASLQAKVLLILFRDAK